MKGQRFPPLILVAIMENDSASALDWSIPGAFTKHTSKHCCTHHYCVKSTAASEDSKLRADTCATSQILFNLSERLSSLHSMGTRHRALDEERNAILRAIVFPGLASCRLKSSYTRVLACSERDIDEGIRLVGSKSHAEINEELTETGGDSKRRRKTRCDATDLEFIVEYFHNDDNRGRPPVKYFLATQ